MDLLNLTAEESIDQPDLLYALNEVPTGMQRELADGVLQAAGAASIFSGFVPSADSASGPVTVGQTGVLNRALLSASQGGQLVTGNLVATAQDKQSVDVSTYAAGTYGIYVAFVRQEGAPESRSIWSGVDLAEYSKVTNTRLVGSWQVRIENPSPGAQWLKIGEATIASAGSGQGVTVSVVDKRPLYFEGTFETLYRPTWGADADRTLRRTATITTFRQMFDALKQCIIDIKGPNVARWYDSFITGLNVGPNFASTDTPTAGRVAAGDAGFYMQGDTYLPTLAFQGSTDGIQFNRSTGEYARVRGGTTNFRIRSDGSLMVGSTSPLYPNVGLNVQTGGSPRTAMFIATSGFGSVGIGGTSVGQGGYIALGDASTLGGTPRFAVYASTGGNGLFELQSSQGVFLRARPNDTYTQGGYATTLLGTTIEFSPQNGGYVQLSTSVRMSDRVVDYQCVTWGVGYFSVADANPNGQHANGSRGNTYNCDTDGMGKHMKIRFNEAIPAQAVIMSGAYAISDDGTNNTGYTCNPLKADANTVKFYLRKGNDSPVWGSFWWRIDYGPT